MVSKISTYLLGIFWIIATPLWAQNCLKLYENIKNTEKEQAKTQEIWLKEVETLRACLGRQGRQDTLWLSYYDLKKMHFFKISQLDSAKHYLELSKQLCETNRWTKYQPKIAFEQGLLYQKQKKPVEAIQQYLRILPAVEASQDRILHSKLLHNLSIVYIELFQYEAGISYLEKAGKVATKGQDYETQGKIYMQLADLYTQIEEFEKAEKVAQKAENTYQKAQMLDYKASAFIRKHATRFRQGKLISAPTIDTLLACLPLLKQGNAGKVTKTTAYIGVANLLIYTQKDLPTAEKLLRETLPVCDSMKLRLNIADIYEAYSQLYKIKAMHTEAYQFYEKYARLKNEIAREGSRLQLNVLKVLHEVAEQQQKIKTLEQTQQNNFLWIVLLSILVVFVLILALVMRVVWRQRLKIADKRATIQSLTLENQSLLNQKLEEENALKTRELATNTLHIIQKNEVLEKLNAEISPLLKDNDLSEQIRKQLLTLRGSIRENEFWEKNWETFRQHFEQIHPLFFENLTKQFPTLTTNELRHCAYIRMNLTRKEVAQLMTVNVEAVKMARNRLKKKLNLAVEEDVSHFLMGF